MKTILAYGDSLTWGCAPDEADGRHAYEDRWPGALEAGLNGEARVIAEGLGGRTTAFDDYTATADRNGARVLPTLIGTHYPLDLVIIMLGTNDIKPFVHGYAHAAQSGVKRLVEIIRAYPYDRGGSVPEILIMAPPLCAESDNEAMNLAFTRAIDESAKFAHLYAQLAEERNCHFFDAAKVAVASPIDGVHLDAANTRGIGEALVPTVRAILGL